MKAAAILLVGVVIGASLGLVARLGRADVADEGPGALGGTVHIVKYRLAPSSPTDWYTKDVVIQSISFIPQSESWTGTCLVTDKSSPTPVKVYDTIPLASNTTYRDAPQDMFLRNGLTISCSDGTVMVQIIVKY